MHFIPTYSYGLIRGALLRADQGERFFALITDRAIRSGSFTGVKQIVQRIDHRWPPSTRTASHRRFDPREGSPTLLTHQRDAHQSGTKRRVAVHQSSLAQQAGAVEERQPAVWVLSRLVAPERLRPGFSWAPAACWCARTLVESMNTSFGWASLDSAAKNSVAEKLCHCPAFDQRAKRRSTLSRARNCSGQIAPSPAGSRNP
jgi:hypothetical protein